MALERIISADDHMDMWAIPPKLFAERLPARLRDRAPVVLEGPEGAHWVGGDDDWGPAGRPHPELPGRFARGGRSGEGNRPGSPELRLEDMDLGGIPDE